MKIYEAETLSREIKGEQTDDPIYEGLIILRGSKHYRGIEVAFDGIIYASVFDEEMPDELIKKLFTLGWFLEREQWAHYV